MLSKRSGAIGALMIAALALTCAGPLFAQDPAEAPQEKTPAKEAPARPAAPAEATPQKPEPAPAAEPKPEPESELEVRDPTRPDEAWARRTGEDARGGPGRTFAPVLAPLPTIALRGRILTRNKAPAVLLDVGGALSLVRVGAELSLGVAPPPQARTAGRTGASAAQNLAIARAAREARGRQAANRRAPVRATPTVARGLPRTLTVVSITDTEVRVKISPGDRVLVLR